MNSAAEINERLNNKEVAGKKYRQRQQQPSSQQNAPGAEAAAAAVEADLEQMRVKVESMTKRMEEGMRKVIDGRLAVEQMKEFVASAAEAARAEASTQASTLAGRSQARMRRGGDDEDEDGEEEYQEFTPTDPSGGTQAVASVSKAWMCKLDDEKIRYQSLSLGQRYAKNNEYIQFKGLVHSSRFPDGEVELPHASAWFTENGAAPQPGVTGAGGDEDDDDDIQIQRTKTSTKCPLTLQEFKDPVTSSKCKHSFEASAILEMIKHSKEIVGAQPAGRGKTTGGEKAVRCPVASCDHMLTKNDLHKDKTIMYHIARLQRARRLEEEDDEDDEGNGSSGRQRVDLIESDAPDVDDYVAEPVMKKEPRGTARSRASFAPRSSRAYGRDEDGDETMEQW